MIAGKRYPYSEEQCLDVHDIACTAIRDAHIKFTPLAYAIFYQAAMNGFTCPLSDSLLAIEKGKTLEYSLSDLYHKYVGDSCLNNIAVLDDITGNLQEGTQKMATVMDHSSTVINQQIDRLDAQSLTNLQLSSIAGSLKKEAVTISLSQDVFLETLSEAQEHIHELKQKVTELQKIVSFDTLTGVYSRFAYDDFIKRTFKRQEYQSLSLVMADIDHFKRLNDTFGHHVGDAVLRYVAQKLKSTLGNDSFVARWGGEEFVLIFTDMTPEAVNKAVEKGRQAIANSKVTIRNTSQEIGSITASFGIAHATRLDKPDTLQIRADKAMYLSKQNGRNQLTIL